MPILCHSMGPKLPLTELLADFQIYRAHIEELVTYRMGSLNAQEIAFLVECYKAVSRCGLLDAELFR